MADTTVKLKADISNLKAQMQAAARQVKLANSEFKAASAGMDDWSTNADGLRAKLKQLDSTLSAQKTQLGLLETQLDKTKEAYGDNSAEADKVKIAINNMKAAIAKTESQISNYSQDLKDCEDGTGKFADETEDATDAMKDEDKEAGNLSDGFTVMKGVMADLVASGVKALISGLKDLAAEAVECFKEFDEGRDTIVKLTGATGELLTELEGSYSGVLSSVVTETETAGEAVGEVNTRFGLMGDELTDLSTKFIKFAELNNTDVKTSIDNVQETMAAWGVETEDAGDLLDLFNSLGQSTSISMNSLTTSLTSNSASLKDMGFNIEEAATFLANLETSGTDSATVLSGLKKALTNAAKEGKTTKEALADLQEEMSNAENDTEAMVSAMELFGNKGGAAIAEACREGRLNFEELGTATQDYKGNLENTYEATIDGTDNIKLAYQSMRTELGEYVSELVDDYAPEIEGVIEDVKDLAEDAIDYVKGHAPEIKDAVTTVIDTVRNGIKTVIENFEGIKSITQAVGTVIAAAFVVTKISAFVQTVISLYKTYQTLKTATDLATTSQLLLNAAEAATPIGLVTAGVAALAAGMIYLASKEIELRQATTTLTDAEQENIDKIWEAKEAYEELTASRDANVSAVNSEYDHYEELAAELDTLVDANGEVLEANQDRANFIITTLNEALGTEMELIDGVIENYNEEKAAIESLIETKRAEAILSANEELYTTAIQNRNTALKELTDAEETYRAKTQEVADAKEELNKLESSSIEQYAADNYITATEAATKYAIAVEEAKRKVGETSGAYVEAKTALIQAGNQYDQYNATIKNYEGLSSAIISGDTKKISTALTEMTYNFQTAETSCKESLEKQVTDYEENLADLEEAIKAGTPGVTQEMVNQAESMVNAAKEELAKFPSEAEAEANASAWSFYTTLGSNANVTLTYNTSAELRDAAQKGLMPNGGEKTAADNFTQGYIDSMTGKYGAASDAAKGMSEGAVSGLNEGQESQSPSKATQRSGENFGQGFINGMNNKTNSVWDTAWNLAKTAINALKSGQQEGSPSKLTYKSGVNFTKGFINGATSMQGALTKAVASLAKSAVKTLTDSTTYDFANAAANVAEKMATTLSNKTTYMTNRLTYENNKKIAEFDAQISKYESEKTAATTKAQKASDKRLAELEKKKAAAADDAAKAKYDKEIAAEKKATTKQIKAIEKDYAKKIATQNKYKTAYQDASSEFLSEFSTAINDYSTKAQDLINSTLNSVGDKYQAKYDALISKQNELVDKLKSAEDLFTVSNAGILTVNDIKAQTKQITDYTTALQKIKGKVSSELFDQIASYDMAEGKAFIDQLLTMSAKDLEAYNKAYTEKMQAAEKAGETIYSQDIKKVGEEYDKELNKALKDLPNQLKDLGTQTMKGFVEGLTKDTDYMSKEVKLYIKSMLATFKKQLKISSPSKIMEQIGDYTGEGFVLGLKDTINTVKKTAEEMASAAATPLSDLQNDIDLSRSAINTEGNGAITNSHSVVNNYNLVQNNTSPKSLSALETYRARRQQIALVKALT